MNLIFLFQLRRLAILFAVYAGVLQAAPTPGPCERRVVKTKDMGDDDLARLIASMQESMTAEETLQAQTPKNGPDGGLEVSLRPSMTVSELEELIESIFPGFCETARAIGYPSPVNLMTKALIEQVISPNEGRYCPDFFVSETKDKIHKKMKKLMRAVFDSHDVREPRAYPLFFELGYALGVAADVDQFGYGKSDFPPPPKVRGEYWDMASGPHLDEEIGRMKKGRHYVLFDTSPLVEGYLGTLAKKLGVSAEVRGLDIRKISKPDKALAVIRSKNAPTYAPGFEKNLEEMVDWIAPGGQLVIQSEVPFDFRPTPFEVMVKKHASLIRRLIQEGWIFAYDIKGTYGLDTIILTRPVGRAKSVRRERAEQIWDDFVAIRRGSFHKFDMVIKL